MDYEGFLLSADENLDGRVESTIVSTCLFPPFHTSEVLCQTGTPNLGSILISFWQF